MKKLLYLILPSTAVLGPMLPGVGRWFGFRLLVLLLFFGTLVASRSSQKGIKTVWRFRYLSVAWLVIGVVGLLSVKDKDAATNAIAAAAVGLLLGQAILVTKDPLKDLIFLQRGWIGAFILTSVFGLRELLTGQHLSNYFRDTNLKMHSLDSSLAASVFGNSNAYAVFLVFIMPILAKNLIESRTRLATVFNGSLNVLCIVFVLASGSRLSIFAVLLQFAVLFRWSAPQFRRRLMSSLLITGLASVLISGAASLITDAMPSKLASATPAKMWAEVTKSSGLSSGEQRLATYKDGLWMVMETRGLGVGAGNFETVMRSADVPYNSGGAVNPHNAYLEILSQYGIALFVLFMLWVVSCFQVARRAICYDTSPESLWGVTVVAIFVGTSLSVLADGNYFYASYNWMAIATVLLACAGLERRERQADHPEESAMLEASLAQV